MHSSRKPVQSTPQPLFLYSDRGEIEALGSSNTKHITSGDITQAMAFLRLYKNSRKTFVSYCAEVERFLLWCEHQSQISLKNITAQHLIDYESFLADPKPLDRWSHPGSARREARFTLDGAVNADWRPFASGGLNSNSIRKSAVIIARLFRQLAFDGHIVRDPRPPGLKRPNSDYSFKDGVKQRYVPQELILLTLDTLSNKGSPKAEYYIARTRYLVALLYYTGLRIHEVVTHTMGKFSQVESEWFLDVRGKGKKRRRIPVPDEFLDALVAYRRLAKLSPFPAPDEKTPLAPDESLKKSIGVRRVDQIIKTAFGHAADTLGDEHPQSGLLRRVSAHWLRHSYGTYLARSGTPLQDIKENFGHASLQTTTVYIAASDQERHQNTRGLSLRKMPKQR